MPLPGQSRPDPSAAEHPFIAWVLGSAGVNPCTYRRNALLRRLPACLRAIKVSNVEQARSLLERQPALLEKAAAALLLGVTEFFRDSAAFDVLARRVLPELAGSSARIRVLSAGCSDGHELYSVAILLDILGALESAELRGVDCRPDAIAAARAGAFRRSDLAPLIPSLRSRYFLPRGQACEAAPFLRARMTWQLGDLARIEPGPGWSLVLFRNVGIYWQHAEAARVCARLAQRLAPGGVLMLGRAERPQPGLGLVQIGPCMFQKPAGGSR